MKTLEDNVTPNVMLRYSEASGSFAGLRGCFGVPQHDKRRQSPCHPLTLSSCLLPLAASERSLYHHAALNPWLMALLFLAAGAMILYLYRAQQRIASRGLVIALTTLRLLLLLSLVVLLLQPAIRWTHHQSSSGTLWLMLDSTGSMGTTDPQSTAVERLRWADALEYLPPEKRPPALAQTLAELACLRDDLSRLKSISPQPSDATAQLGQAITAWRQQLDDAVAQLSAQAKAQPAAGVFASSLQQTSKLAADAVTSTAGKGIADAVNAIPWSRLESDLDAAIKTLSPVADRADADFLQAHIQDAAVKDAMAKVAKLSRSQLAQLVLTQKSSRAGGLNAALPSYRVRLASFADKAVASSPADAADLPDAIRHAMATGGQSTNLAAGLLLIADQSTNDEPASVVILSDGRQNVDADAAAAARTLASQNTRVYALGIGSNQLAIDAAVEAIDAPDWVYKDDAVRASARIRTDGLAGRDVPVEFWRGRTKLDTKRLNITKPREVQVVRFLDPHPEPGVHDYEIRVPELPGEENKDNNRQPFRVSVKKDQLKMLIVDDQARWEYRHLVSYLSRDPRVKLQTVLAQPTRIDDVRRPDPVKASPVNPKTEAQILPETKEEWLAFDIIVLGDVAATDLPAEAQKNLVAAVKDGGKALIIIAGQRNMPGAYANGALADALPVSLASDWSADAVAEHLKSGYRPRLTAEGAASILSQFKPDPEENAATWSDVPPWYWHSEQTQAKPAATVLWSIETSGDVATDPPAAEAVRRRALLATSSYGSGRVMYLAGDQTWRLRQVHGENLQERFWGQVVRWAAGNDLPAGGERCRFGSDKPTYSEGDSAIVTARLLKEDLTPLAGQSIEVIARSAPASTTEPASAPADSKIIGQSKLVEVEGSPGLYRAALTGLPPGRFTLSLRGGDVDKLLADVTDEKQKSLLVSVQPQLTVEQRDTNTDKPKLAEIAKAGGGIALDGPYAAALARHLPRPMIEQTSIEQFGFFGDPKSRYTRLTHWVFLGIFCLLITAEWVIRKAGGLV